MITVHRILGYCNQSRPWSGDLSALAAGVLMPLGFAPFGWRVVPIIALAVLFLLVQTLTPKRAAGRCFLFGLGMFGFGVSWVYNSLHDYGLAIVPVAALIAASLVLALSCFLAVVGAVYRRWFAFTPVYDMLLILPALWVLIEWSRSWMFTGFPWLLLGYSQIDTWLDGYVPMGGVLLAGLVAAVISGALGLLVMVRDVRQRLLAVGIILILPFIGYVIEKINWVEPAGKPLSVALVQGSIPQDVKMQPGNLQMSLDRYVELTEPYLNRDLIIWPETAIHASSFRVEGFLQEMEAKVRAYHSELLTGIFVHDFKRNTYYNSLLELGDGKRSNYYKQRLVPFGEYMPFRSILEFAKYYIDIPSADITPAKPGKIMRLAGYPAALGICYESAYPQIYRRQLPQSAFMVNVSNDAWFGDSLAPHQHLEIARARALEAGRFMLRATNTGISALIDFKGRVIVRGKQFEKEVVTGEFTPLRGATPFIRLGNWLVLLLCIAALIAARLLSGKNRVDKAHTLRSSIRES